MCHIIEILNLYQNDWPCKIKILIEGLLNQGGKMIKKNKEIVWGKIGKKKPKQKYLSSERER